MVQHNADSILGMIEPSKTGIIRRIVEIMGMIGVGLYCTNHQWD
jgi:hypothetical protein